MFMLHALYPPKPDTYLVRPRDFRRQTGLTQSSYLRGVNDGTIPPPVKIGPRQVAHPNWVVDDFIGHKVSSQEPFDAKAYLRQVGGQIVNPITENRSR